MHFTVFHLVSLKLLLLLLFYYECGTTVCYTTNLEYDGSYQAAFFLYVTTLGNWYIVRRYCASKKMEERKQASNICSTVVNTGKKSEHF